MPDSFVHLLFLENFRINRKILIIDAYLCKAVC